MCIEPRPWSAEKKQFGWHGVLPAPPTTAKLFTRASSTWYRSRAPRCPGRAAAAARHQVTNAVAASGRKAEVQYACDGMTDASSAPPQPAQHNTTASNLSVYECMPSLAHGWRFIGRFSASANKVTFLSSCRGGSRRCSWGPNQGVWAEVPQWGPGAKLENFLSRPTSSSSGEPQKL